MFCRNCDTAIEVSERDVSTFESQGSFECPSCKEDLSARMADLLGANRVPPSEERTVAEEESADNDAFDGLPVGGTLDDAARSIRTPSPTPLGSGGAGLSSTAGAVPEVGAEDPLTLALRIAHQAQAAALAVAAAAEAPVSNGAAHPESEPIAEATAPGVPSFAPTNGAKSATKSLEAAAGGASSEVGVVPEEPDNEDTVRRDAASATASTVDSGTGAEATVPEPTAASDADLLVSDTSDSGPVIGEETPALTESQRASLLAEENEPDTVVEEPSHPDEDEPERAPPPPRRSVVPEAPSAEPTPSAPRASPMPAEPREEPTIRKSGPPPALVAPTRLAPRTGTGPSGIGALGFRISSNRPVVRPNGRASSPSIAAVGVPTTPAAGTPIGNTSIDRGERVSVERPFDRPSRTGFPAAGRAPAPVVTAVPEPPPLVAGRMSDSETPALPVWLLGVGVGVVTLIVGGLAFLLFGGGGSPDEPILTPTPVVETTPVSTDTSVAVLATPLATATTPPASTRTPTATRTSAPTQAPAQTPNPTATPAQVAAITKSTPSPTPRPPDGGKALFEETVRGKAHKNARLDLQLLAKKPENLSKPDFLYESWSYLAKSPPAEADLSRKIAYEPFAKEFLSRFRNDPRSPLVKQWVDRYNAKPTP